MAYHAPLQLLCRSAPRLTEHLPAMLFRGTVPLSSPSPQQAHPCRLALHCAHLPSGASHSLRLPAAHRSACSLAACTASLHALSLPLSHCLGSHSQCMVAGQSQAVQEGLRSCSRTPPSLLLTHLTAPTRSGSSTTCSAVSREGAATSSTSSALQGEEEEVSAAELQARLSQLSSRAHQHLGIPLISLQTNQWVRMMCPFCRGGTSGNDKDTFSLSPSPQGTYARYICFR